MYDESCNYPITHPQQRILYTEKYYQNTSIGNIAATVKVTGTIDYQLFEQAINIMVEKNEGLRLRIVEKYGQVKQYVSEYQYRKIDFLDFTNDGLEAFNEWELQQVKVPFVIEDSDLFYFALAKINDEELRWFVKVHHLVTDAWSMVLLGDKVIEYYDALKDGKEIENTCPSYIDYIDNEQQYKNSKRFITDKEYWNNMFETVPEAASLAKKDASSLSGKANRKTFIIPEALVSKIRQYSQDYKTSIFSIFLSILAIYIHRITDNDDIVLGTPVLNRSNHKEKRTMGMFASTVPLRIRMENNTDYENFVKNTTNQWMGMLRHQRYPYDLLLKDLRKKHKNMDNLYDILLSYQNAKFHKNSGTYFESIWHPSGYQTDPLFIHINDREGEGSLVLDYDYRIQLFNDKDITHIHKSLINLLFDAINNPQRPINMLSLHDEDEKRHILDVFNNTKSEYELDKTVQELFEIQASKTPDNIAVVFNNKYLTYKELNEKSNQLARLLRKRGVGPDSIVGILTSRSLEMIIGIMAILKAGGCYLPIDHEYPQDRIDYMLQDSRVKIILTSDSLESKLSYQGITIQLDNELVYNDDESNLDVINSPDDLAYVIYTSGSTGRPKAVMVEHRALVNYITAVEQFLDYGPGGSVLSVTTIAFDIFVFEIFPSLAKGLKIVLANELQQKIPELLSELIINEKVEKILTTPSRMQMLVFGQCHKKCFDVLKEIVLGGEAFPQKLLDGLRKITKARIFNMYGPTEATVYSTLKELTEDQEVNIGRPLSNYKIYIVDKYFNLVPRGVQGELCISGNGVARGYLNNDELTDEKFITNPFEPNKKMYRTGDYGRWSMDGEIEFMGRMDHQVKIKGYRIELGEIENQIRSHRSVKDAVVIDRQDDNGRKQLCGYYVSENNIPGGELKRLLSEKLPDYMIPSSFTKINNIPLTPNGKIDRRGLPEPKMLINCSTEYMGPRNQIDETLTAIWKDVLNIEDMGIDDNFFDMGGDSLSIIEVQIEMLKYDWNFNTQEFYRFDTVRKLSDRICGIMDSNETLNAMEEIALASYTKDSDQPIEIHKQGFKYSRVLLTGATGFLGIHLLKDLLSNTDSKIYCLVRGKDDNDARQRLVEGLKFYFPNDIDDIGLDRIFVARGDISYIKFGLEQQIYNSLGEEVDLVIHTAAIVKYFGEYEYFENINVKGTEMCGDFCIEFDKPLAYISTLGVSGNYLVGQQYQGPIFTEKDFYIGQKYLDNVYVRSKFEAENILYQKMDLGLKVNILRIGNLTSRYSDGQFQRNADENAFYSTLRSLAGIGAVNKEVLEQRLEFTPVDLCSRAIITLVNVENFDNRVYHVFNHNLISINNMLEMFREANIEIKAMKSEEFSNYISQIVLDDKKKKYLVGIINDLNKSKFLDFGSFVNIGSATTINNLRQLGFEWPQIDKHYITKVITYMKTNGFIG